jgi:hypothetical protein
LSSRGNRIQCITVSREGPREDEEKNKTSRSGEKKGKRRKSKILRDTGAARKSLVQVTVGEFLPHEKHNPFTS